MKHIRPSDCIKPTRVIIKKLLLFRERQTANSWRNQEYKCCYMVESHIEEAKFPISLRATSWRIWIKLQYSFKFEAFEENVACVNPASMVSKTETSSKMPEKSGLAWLPHQKVGHAMGGDYSLSSVKAINNL